VKERGKSPEHLPPPRKRIKKKPPGPRLQGNGTEIGTMRFGKANLGTSGDRTGQLGREKYTAAHPRGRKNSATLIYAC